MPLVFGLCRSVKYVDLDAHGSPNRLTLSDSPRRSNDRALSLGTLMRRTKSGYAGGQEKKKHGFGRQSGLKDSRFGSIDDELYEQDIDCMHRRHSRTSTGRLSNLDLDLFRSAAAFYTWSTTHQSRHATLSSHAGYDNVVATKISGGDHWTCTVKGNMIMHDGEHYFECEVMPGSSGGVMVGVAREDVNPNSCHHTRHGSGPQRAWFAVGMLGTEEHSFGVGDRAGVYVNLTAGTVSFFKNGKPFWQPQQISGHAWQKVSGPLVPAVQMFDEGDAVRFISEVRLPAAVSLEMERKNAEAICP